MVIDSSGIFPQETPPNTQLLLTGSPKLNLERVLSNFKPEVIIADGSNYPSLIKKWKATAIENNIPFYYTGLDGAYVIK